MKIDWGIIIGILGIVSSFFISLFFFLKGKKKKKLLLDLDTIVVVSESLSRFDSLKISYNNEEIKSLSSSTIIIRNIGNDIIEPTDIVPSEPIIIETNGNFLLQDISKYGVKCSNSKNRAGLRIVDTNHISVDFDFLNPKDEIKITILHSGNIKISGDLKRGETKNSNKNEKYKKLFEDDKDNYEVFSNKHNRNIFFITMLGICAAILFCIMPFYNVQFNKDGYIIILYFVLFIISNITWLFNDRR